MADSSIYFLSEMVYNYQKRSVYIMNYAVCGYRLAKTFGLEEGYQMLADAGFHGVDFSFFEAPLPTDKETVLEKGVDEMEAFFKPYIDAIKKAGLTIPVSHAPYPSYRPGDDAFNAAIKETYKQLILLCDRIGCPYIVVHPLSAHPGIPYSYKELEKINLETYTSLIPTLQQTNVKVCLENMSTTKFPNGYEGTFCDAAEAAVWIDTLNEMAGKDCFAFCVDIGHLLLTHNKPEHFIEKLGHRIQAVHLHDNCTNGDNHALPFTGKANWEGICKSLSRIGYNGYLNFEVLIAQKPKPLAKPMLDYMVACGKVFEELITGEN